MPMPCLVLLAAWATAAVPGAWGVPEPEPPPGQVGESLPDPYLHQDEPYVMNGPVYAYFNHNSKTWDKQKTTRAATVDLNTMSRALDIPVISNVENFRDDKPVDNHFLDAEQITYPLLSRDGSHALRFPDAEAFLVSGGYLEHCLRRTLRDIYSGVQPSRRVRALSIYLITDAVYVSGSRIRQAFDRPRDDLPETVEQHDTFPLADAMVAMSDHALVEYLRDEMRYAPASFVPEQARVHIFRDGRRIDSSGGGRFAIYLILIDTESIEKHLPAIVRRAENRNVSVPPAAVLR